MQYWDIVVASFRIPWRHRYLWLLALFAGEGGTSFNFNTGSSGQSGSGSGTPDPARAGQQLAGWLQDHIALLVVLVVLWLLLVIAFFILAAVCEAAVVRAAAEHDAQRPFGLGLAWRSGVHRMWSMVRFRLLVLALGLPAVLLVGALIAGTTVAAIGDQTGLAVVLGIFAALAALAAIVYLVYLFFLDRLGTRALVLEQLQARDSIVRAHRLFRKRLGRALLVWLVSIGVGIVVGIAFGVAFLALALPAIGLAVGAIAGSVAILWVLFALYVLALLLVAIVVGSFIAAESSTYWTLAFRRLDLDYTPVAYMPAPR